MKQAVLKYEFVQSKYSRPGHGCNKLYLACRHEKYQKASIQIPNKTSCYYCDRGLRG